MDEENFIWYAPDDVPAEIQPDGEVTENNTGEQVANEGGNPVWWDETYPGQITNSAANPTQDAYGLNILSATQTTDLTRNINPAFINNLVDPNTPTAQTVKNAVNTSASNVPVYVDANGVVFNSATGLSYPVDRTTGRQIIPTDVAAAIDPVAQSRIEAFNRTPTIFATAVNPGQSNLAGPPDTFIKDANGDWQINPKYPVNTAPAPVAATSSAVPVEDRQLLTSPKPVIKSDPTEKYTDTRQTAVDAARLNAQSEFPNPYLTNIEKSGAEIAKGQAGIATANETIKSAQQKIVDSESIIAQNNAELADPNISAERRAVLEANNAAQVQNVLDQTQSINENQAYITNTQDTIQFNEAVINDNAAAYRDTTNPAVSTTVPITVDPNVTAAEQNATSAVITNPTTAATPVNPANTGFSTTTTGVTAPFFGTNPDAEAEAAAAAQVGRQLAQQQEELAAQKRTVNNGDWRVRLSLAPGANYLYNVDATGILNPLQNTNGVIFPYTPKIELSYKADYESYALTHSNYKGYFYKSSYTDAVGLTATFTAQDTAEANYLLAVIHFFRSVTKMFYGQDPQRGAPPPLVYLSGLGQYQFAAHPCVVTSFNYNLPSDVDYIRARSTNINGTNMLTRRDKQDLPTNPISGAVARLQNLFSGQGISYGAEICRPPPPTLGQNQPTYVPTRMDIQLSLLPVQTRSQVSKQFSLRSYANGDLLKGGFW